MPSQHKAKQIQDIEQGSFSEESKKKAVEIYNNEEYTDTEADLLVDAVLAEELEAEAVELGVSSEPTKKDVELAKDALSAQAEVSEFAEQLQ